MYIKDKGGGIVGPDRLGRVTYSRTVRSLHYKGRRFDSLGGRWFKANYCDETGQATGSRVARKTEPTLLYSTTVDIDDDGQEEYWRKLGTSLNQGT